jgi:hypothetical protein
MQAAFVVDLAGGGMEASRATAFANAASLSPERCWRIEERELEASGAAASGAVLLFSLACVFVFVFRNAMSL